MQNKICPADPWCMSKAERLGHADYFDFDYDTITQSVVLSAFWAESPCSGIWDEKIDKKRTSDRVEVGVLTKEEATQPEEMSFGGFLAVPGDDSKPSTSCLQVI